MAVMGSQDGATGAWVWLRPQLSEMLTLNWLKASRAGSVKNHNLRVADGRWYGMSVVLRYTAVRKEETA